MKDADRDIAEDERERSVVVGGAPRALRRR